MDVVGQLAAPGRTLEHAGSSLSESLASAGDTVARVPLVGDDARAPFSAAGGAADSIARAGVEVQQPETNLVFFRPEGAGITGEKMVSELRQRGVLLAMMDGRIRACTHLDVTAAMIEETLGLVRDIARGG